MSFQIIRKNNNNKILRKSLLLIKNIYFVIFVYYVLHVYLSKTNKDKIKFIYINCYYGKQQSEHVQLVNKNMSCFLSRLSMQRFLVFYSYLFKIGHIVFMSDNLFFHIFFIKILSCHSRDPISRFNLGEGGLRKLSLE